MQKLEPCPFCGGSAEYVRIGDRRASSVVGCTDCHGQIEANEEGEHNGSAWNRRVTKVPAPAESDPPTSLAESVKALNRPKPGIKETLDTLGHKVSVAAIAVMLFGGIQVGLWLWLLYFSGR